MSLGGGGSSGSGTQTLDPQIKSDWLDLYHQAQNTNNNATPTRGVAGFSPTQQIGQQLTLNNAFDGLPATARGVDVANQLTNLGANPSVTAQTFPGSDLSGYLNPYTQDVANTTMNQLDLARRQSLNQNGADATLQGGEGAWGGARAGVSDALTNEGFARTAASTLAGLNQQGFDTAAGLQQADANRTLAADQTSAQYKDAGLNRELGAAGLLGQLGAEQQNQGLAGAGAITGVGQQQQNQMQNIMDTGYQNQMSLRNLPLQTLESAFGIIPSTNSGSVTHSNSKSGTFGLGG